MGEESTILDVESPEARIASRDARIYVLELRVKLLRALLANSRYDKEMYKKAYLTHAGTGQTVGNGRKKRKR